MKWLFTISVIVACALQHHVRLVLGPSPGVPSRGFLCQDALGAPLITHGITNGTFDAYLVVDLISLGNHFPGCLGEDIITTCQDGTCGPLVSDGARFCKRIQFPVTDADPTHFIDSFQAELAKLDPITQNAPDHPLIVRAVITQQDCSTLMTSSTSMWPALDGTKALGCAYSCPVVLDQVQNDLSLGLDLGIGQVTNAQCVQAVEVCAQFPNI